MTGTKKNESASRKSQTITKTKYDLKKRNKNQNRSKSDCSKLVALQEALQDPITSCEGI